MAIIGTLPVTLANNTLADATQVMADLNFIVSQANSNAAGVAQANNFTVGTQTINGDVIATLTALQTLTQKTLTSPTINGAAIATSTLTADTVVNGLVFTNSNQVGATTLDWFDRPTVWSPTMVGLTTPGVVTYTQQLGKFTRIGGVVMFTFSVSWSATTGSGNIAIANFPYTVSSGAGNDGGIAIYFASLVGITGPFSIVPLASTVRAQLFDGSGSAVPMKATGTIAGQGFFFV